MINIIFVSPHLKKIGETYLFERFINYNQPTGFKSRFYVFNVCGEWDHLQNKSYVLENPFRKVVDFCPNLEAFSPWWHYRLWLCFVSLSILLGLPVAIRRFTKGANNSKFLVVARMATAAVSLSSILTDRKKVKFVASMAGVPLLNLYRKWTWFLLYKSFNHVVCPTPSMVQYLTDLLRPTALPISIIENPVLEEKDIERFDPKLASREYDKDYSSEPLKLLAVGRLSRQKGIDTLLRAVSLMDGNVSLTVIGEGEDSRMLQKLAQELGISENVEFRGYEPQPFSGASSFDLYVMSSRWDGPGHTIIEALASGIPSIVSDCPFGPSDTVQNGKFGLIFETDDAHDLAAKITIARDKYSEICKRLEGYRSEFDKFTISSVAKKWNDLGQRICR